MDGVARAETRVLPLYRVNVCRALLITVAVDGRLCIIKIGYQW